MSALSHEVVNCVRRLADTLATLRLRVREAVAGETGRAVGEAVRELLAAALDGRLTQFKHRPQGRNWEEPDPWHEEDEVRRVVTTPARLDDDASPARNSRGARRWAATLAFAATTARCWAARHVPAWVALGLGSLAGLAAWSGGQLARSGLALLAAVGDLFPPLEPTGWGYDFF